MLLMMNPAGATAIFAGKMVSNSHLAQAGEPSTPTAQDKSQSPTAGAPLGEAPLMDRPHGLGPEEPVAPRDLPSDAPTPEPEMDEVNQYLWGVYERSTVKRDGSGDFTWKDAASAARLGMTLGDYVIVGMDRDFRELLYRAGLAMDAAGFRWTILSGFRDDYRQGLASGYKARIGDSLHGGSITTGGYGHGCAVDITDADSNPQSLRTWLDANSALLNLERPLPGIDPAHVQARGPWHEVATMLRHERLAGGEQSQSSSVPAEAADLSVTFPTEADLRCIGLHHHRPDPLQADLPERRDFKVVVRAHRVLPAESSRGAGGPVAAGGAKAAGKTGSRAAEARLPPRNKATARSISPHAAHPTPRNAGST
jgi:hypothetical protein